MDEAVARACLDDVERQAEVDASAFGEHERLAGRHQVMKASMLVITFDHRCLAKADVKTLPPMASKPEGASRRRPVASDEHGDLACRSLWTPPVTGDSRQAMPFSAARPASR